MTSTQWHRPAAVGIALEATVLTGAIAMDGTAQTSTTSIPTTVDQHDDQLIVGTGPALLPSAARSDVLERLGERSDSFRSATPTTRLPTCLPCQAAGTRDLPVPHADPPTGTCRR